MDRENLTGRTPVGGPSPAGSGVAAERPVLSALRAAMLVVACSFVAFCLVDAVWNRAVEPEGVLRVSDAVKPIRFGLMLAVAVLVAPLAARSTFGDVPSDAVRRGKRALSVVALAACLGATLLFLVLLAAPRDNRHEGLVASSVVLVLLFASTRPPRHGPANVEIDAREAPGGLLPPAPRPPPVGEGPTTYRLDGAGPAVPSDEAEELRPVVEVRMLWGGDLLSVTHLDPPRSFHVGSGEVDVRIEPDLLGATQLPIVLVEDDGITVPGSPPASAKRVDLPDAKTVRITLSSTTRTPFRTADASAGGVPASLVFEVTRVRAGRAVGRGVSLAANGRLVASFAVATFALVGPLWVSSRLPPTNDEVIDRDQLLFMQRMLQAEAERLAEYEVTEDVPELQNQDPAHCGNAGPCRRARWHVIDDVPERVRILPDGHRVYDGWQWPWPMTSFRDAFWFDPHDSFLLLPDSSALTVLPQPHVLGMVGDLAPAASGVTVGTPTALGSYAEGVLAGMGLEPRLLARIRRCYDHGTLHTPGLKGRVVVHFDINRLGEMSKLAAGPESTLRDADTAACVVHSFEGMAFARPAFGSASVIFPIDLAPAR